MHRTRFIFFLKKREKEKKQKKRKTKKKGGDYFRRFGFFLCNAKMRFDRIFVNGEERSPACSVNKFVSRYRCGYLPCIIYLSIYIILLFYYLSS